MIITYFKVYDISYKLYILHVYEISYNVYKTSHKVQYRYLINYIRYLKYMVYMELHLNMYL